MTPDGTVGQLHTLPTSPQGKVSLPIRGRIGHASIGLAVMLGLCIRVMVITGGLGNAKVGMWTLKIFLPEEVSGQFHGLTAPL